MIMSSGWYKFTSKVSQKKKALNLLKLLFDWFDSTGSKLLFLCESQIEVNHLMKKIFVLSSSATASA